MSIYKEMINNWKTYCMMSSLLYIEEMNKPNEYLQIKRYKDRTYNYICFSSLELRMKDIEFLQAFFKITKHWEEKLDKKFLGQSFNEIKIDNLSKQYKIILAPTWLAYILNTCGSIPNIYSLKTGIKRINSIKQKRNEKLNIDLNTKLMDVLFEDKKLAAGAFIVSMDLEFRGIQSGKPSLTMSEKYRDFLDFMLKVAQKWDWTKNKALSPVKVDYSRKLGINASPQFEFRITVKGLKEIYKLAGPLVIPQKNKCIEFNISRSKNYKNIGGKFKSSGTKEKIFNELKKNPGMSSTYLQFIANVGVDVVLDHLHNLEKEGKVIKERAGKRYLWRIK